MPVNNDNTGMQEVNKKQMDPSSIQSRFYGINIQRLTLSMQCKVQK